MTEVIVEQPLALPRSANNSNDLSKTRRPNKVNKCNSFVHVICILSVTVSGILVDF